MCKNLFMHEFVCVFLCVCVLACVCLREQAESHLQSMGSLIDWIKPPGRAQTEWKLNKITVIYSSGNGNLSGDSGAADLCPATQIWAEMPNIQRTASPRRETPDALWLRRINQSASSHHSHLSPPASCQDSDSPRRPEATLPVPACPPPRWWGTSGSIPPLHTGMEFPPRKKLLGWIFIPSRSCPSPWSTGHTSNIKLVTNWGRKFWVFVMEKRFWALE